MLVTILPHQMRLKNEMNLRKTGVASAYSRLVGLLKRRRDTVPRDNPRGSN
jgi:hypothetical protein